MLYKKLDHFFQVESWVRAQKWRWLRLVFLGGPTLSSADCSFLFCFCLPFLHPRFFVLSLVVLAHPHLSHPLLHPTIRNQPEVLVKTTSRRIGNGEEQVAASPTAEAGRPPGSISPIPAGITRTYTYQVTEHIPSTWISRFFFFLFPSLLSRVPCFTV